MPQTLESKKNTILVVDDESQIRKLVKIILNDEGFKHEEASLGAEALRLTASIKPSLIILDLGLPDMDGKEIIKKLREWSQIPIIVCSVRDDDDEIIAALNQGADDYITKPFNPDILVARIQSNLRKNVINNSGEPNIKNGNIEIDLVKHVVLIDGKNKFFTPKEYELLKYFVENKGKMVTHKQLLKELWGPAHSDDMQYLRVYISQLREKIESNPKKPVYIITEPGIGYRMEIIKD